MTLRVDGLKGAAGENVSIQSSAKSQDARPTRTVPERVTLDIHVECLLARALTESFLGGFLELWAGSVESGEAVPRTAGPSQLGLLPLVFEASAEFMKAGTRIALNRLEIGGDDYEFIGNGAVGADPAAVFQVSGGFDVTVRNLRGAMAQAGTQAILPGGAALVDILEEIGRVSASDGTKYYRVDITQTGAVLINGQNFATLVEKAGARAQ